PAALHAGHAGPGAADVLVGGRYRGAALRMERNRIARAVDPRDGDRERDLVRMARDVAGPPCRDMVGARAALDAVHRRRGAPASYGRNPDDVPDRRDGMPRA